MARPRKLKKIQFLDQRPNRKIRRVEVHLRETVLSHEAITVSVRDRRTGNAVHGCEVEMLTLEGVRVAAAPTQSNGEAVFGAPCVDNPTTFEFLLKSGTHTSYVDDAPGFAGGLQPLHLCTVLSDIALVSASTVTRDPHQFEIDQGFSWWGSYGFPELGAKLQRRRRRLGSSTDADKSEIENHIRHKGPGDVYVFLGHTFANATGATAGLCSGDDELVTPDDLKAAAGKRGLPGIGTRGPGHHRVFRSPARRQDAGGCEGRGRRRGTFVSGGFEAPYQRRHDLRRDPRRAATA